MKRLRKFALNLDRQAWPNEYGYSFYLKSRCLCNFVERTLKKVSVELVDSTKLCITGVNGDSVGYCVNSSNIASLSVPFDQMQYDSISLDRDVHIFITEFAKSNILKIPESSRGSTDKLIAIIQQFETEGCKNEWQHKKKSFRDLGITASLDCVLSLAAFELRLHVKKGSSEVFADSILKTDPDEIAFHHKFKDVKIDKDKLVVTTKSEEALYELPLERVGINT